MTVSGFFDRHLAGESARETRALHEIIFKLCLALAGSGLWGAAAACTQSDLMLANLIKVPMVLLLSVLTVLPIALYARRLLGLEVRDVLLAELGSITTSATILSVFAPLVALFVRTSGYGAQGLCIASAAVAILVGGGAFLLRLHSTGSKKQRALWLGVLLVAAQLLATLQLVALASPILPTPTVFATGVDGLLGGR